jgi:cobalamin biosynthetic protein CobC
MKSRYAEAPDPWLDLSTGLNPAPWPWTDNVDPAVLNAASASLPDDDLVDFCQQAWTKYLNAANADNWSLCAGSQAIINLLPQLFPEHEVLLPDPTYGEHVRVWKNAGQAVTRFTGENFSDLPLTGRQVLIITNPNNPDGRLFDPDVLLRVATQLETQGSFLVVDEAFCDLMPDQSLASRDLPSNVIILRSLGKFFGLAGLRIGLFHAAPELHVKVQALLGPWPVNGLALLIAGHALQDEAWIELTRNRLMQDGTRLQNVLSACGLQIVGATDLFCRVSSDEAPTIAHTLARQGIYVRTFVENNQLVRFGLPNDDDGFSRLETALKP